MESHEHNADPSFGPVCSHLLTFDHFESWGLATQITDKICGSWTVMREGLKPSVARNMAWKRGLVRLCTIPPVVATNFSQSEERRLEAVAWADEHLRDKDRRTRDGR